MHYAAAIVSLPLSVLGASAFAQTPAGATVIDAEVLHKAGKTACPQG